MNEVGSLDEVDALSLIRDLNESDEHTRCEAKTSQQLGRSLMETICAFSNEPGLGGGLILTGVAKTEDSFWPTYDFVGLDNPDQLQADIASQSRTAFNRPIRPQMKTCVVRGKPSVIVFVPEAGHAEKPIFFQNEGLPKGAYRRIGSTDQRCSEDDLLVFYGGQQVDTFDRQVVDDSSMDDIDSDAIALYRTMRKDIKPDAEELAWTDEELLIALSCAKRSKSGLKATVAGILLFGRQQALRRCFPMMRIDYVRVPGQKWVENPDKRFDTVEIREPLIRAVQRTRATIMDDLPKAFSLPVGSLQREDVPRLPDRVIREVVVNAVMHRSYRIHGPLCIIRYSNRLEIQNPGHSLVSEERLGQPGSETRNPALAAVLYDIGFAETKGSGIRAMRKMMKDALLTPPVFESDREGNRFVAYLLLHHFLTEEDILWLSHFGAFDLTDDEQRSLILAREMGAIDNATYRSLNGVDTLTASGHLRRLRDFDLLRMKGKGARTYYVPTDAMLTPKPSGLTTEPSGLGAEPSGLADKEVEPLPRELKVEIGALGKKASQKRVKQAILNLCSWRELRPSEIAAYMGRNQDYLRQTFISKLLDEELLDLTSDPSNPRVAYRTSPKGTQWLENNS